jgi:hypothetical protein
VSAFDNGHPFVSLARSVFSDDQRFSKMSQGIRRGAGHRFGGFADPQQKDAFMRRQIRSQKTVAHDLVWPDRFEGSREDAQNALVL